MNNLGLTLEQVNNALYGDNIHDDEDNELYEWIKEKIVYTDTEKNMIDKEVVIQQVSTGKFYKAKLLESQWVGQDEQNLNAEWKEVKPKKKKEVEYE